MWAALFIIVKTGSKWHSFCQISVMKTKSSIAILLITALLFSCKKDKEVQANPSIKGVWNLEKEKYTTLRNGNSVIQNDSITYNGTGSTFDFNNDGKLYIKQLDGSTFVYDTVRYKVASDNSFITLTFADGSNSNQQVLELSNNKAVLYFTETATINTAGETETYKVWTTLIK